MNEENKPQRLEVAKENMRLTYEAKNDGLKIKQKTMGLLYKQVELLAEEAQRYRGNNRKLIRISKVKAMLGQAILPD